MGRKLWSLFRILREDYMKYGYGTVDNYKVVELQFTTPADLAEIIKEDVDCGKWNCYDGGKAYLEIAHCKYQKNNFTTSTNLLIFGTTKEFKRLEELIKDFIKVNPRVFN